MFRGATLVNLDSKGRLSVPTRYRDELNENASGQMVCTIDINHSCLLLYPLPEWEIIEQKLSRLSSMNPQERRVQRLLLGHASECQMDSAGRLLIAPILRQHAGLTKEVMLVGQFNKFEQWDETTWYQQVKDDIDAEQSDSANSRMQNFQMEPAPIQIKWVGGLISSTGLAGMDYLLSDAVETPDWADALYTEKLIRMPDDYICYDPPFYLPPVSDMPVKTKGFFTFGCFNNASKINDFLLNQWAVLLHSVPDSRLFLKSFNFDNENLKERVLTTLEGHGIARERVRIEGKASHQTLLSCYNDVDIALDPWPYSGGLTTCEALAMGVPVVTLPGPTFAGRHSASHLVNAGLQELVASDWQNFIDITVGLTRDLQSLEIIRSNMRAILLASPVCDGQRYAKHFSQAMRAVWQRYCEGKKPEALTLRHDEAPYFLDDCLPVELQMPEDVDVVAKKIESEGFSFQLAGKVITMDFGGSFTTSKKFISLTELDSFFFIIMDTLGIVEDKHLPPRRKSMQHIKLHTLGNGELIPVYMCMDNRLSSTLKPLSALSTPGAEILVELKSQSSKLDSIHGLEKVDLFALDNKFDLSPAFEYGARIFQDCLTVEVKITFVSTHQGQMSLDAIVKTLTQFGFVFHSFTEIEYGEPKVFSNAEKLASTQMVSGKAIFVPDEQKLRDLDQAQREKLAFITHVVYGLHDFAAQLLEANSTGRAEKYINEILVPHKIAEAEQRKHTLPQKLIVSLTSWHKRFSTLQHTLQCLLKQTVKADRIILWLAESERHLVPESVFAFAAKGIEIKYCEDIRSYKKIVPTLLEEPNAFIVTADDDLAYEPEWLERLIAGWNGDYKTAVAHRAHKIRLNQDNTPVPYKDWEWNYSASTDLSDLIFPTSGFGVLYPPQCFHGDMLKKNIFEKLSPGADDVWLFWMCRLNGVKFNVVPDRMISREWQGTSENGLWQTNLLKGENDKYIKNMIEKYGFAPESKSVISRQASDSCAKREPQKESLAFRQSGQYWDDRYRLKGNSGAGSYGRLADFKAEVINDFVKQEQIQSVMEFGCGDGNQLSLAVYPRYTGFDVSEHAIQLCKNRFSNDATKDFYSVDSWDGHQAELAMSLDVIYHLIEDEIFEKYMNTLFSAGSRFVIVYASNNEEFNVSISKYAQHVHHRKFTDWVEKNMGESYVLHKFIPNKYQFDAQDQNNTSFADFYIFRRRDI
jgi:division/cell wall cluster transcriptional repressor MraZ